MCFSIDGVYRAIPRSRAVEAPQRRGDADARASVRHRRRVADRGIHGRDDQGRDVPEPDHARGPLAADAGRDRTLRPAVPRAGTAVQLAGRVCDRDRRRDDRPDRVLPGPRTGESGEEDGGGGGGVVGRGSWVVGRGSWVVVRGLWVVVRGSWFVGRGSWFVVRGSWFVGRGSPSPPAPLPERPTSPDSGSLRGEGRRRRVLLPSPR